MLAVLDFSGDALSMKSKMVIALITLAIQGWPCKVYPIKIMVSSWSLCTLFDILVIQKYLMREGGGEGNA